MSLNKIILILGVVFLSFGSLFAKDYDSTHELPDVRQPDKHRIFIRGTGGYGGLNFPTMSYLKNELYTNVILDGFVSLNTLNYLRYNNSYGATTSQYELEYRYLDKFRLFTENRKLANLKDGKIDPRNLHFRENYSSIGVAYFHPISPNFNLGVSLRRVDIDQMTQRNYGTVDFGFIGTSSFTALSLVSREFSMNARGIVPGIHIEIKPLRWFEIHLGRQFYNLTGTDAQTTILGGIVSIGNRSARSDDLNVSNGTIGYTGEKTTLDFVFRFSSWFATKWGYNLERYTMKYKDYFIYTGNPASSLFYSALEGSQKQKYDFASMNFTIEFSKSFGE